MNLSKRDMRDIGLDYYLSAVNTMTPFGTKRKKAMRWYGEEDLEALHAEWDHIDYFSKMLTDRRTHLDPALNAFCLFRDIEASVESLGGSNALDDVGLFEIKRFAMTTRKIIDNHHRHCADFKALDWASMDALIALLDPEREGLDTFYIYNTYSKKLENFHLRRMY